MVCICTVVFPSVHMCNVNGSMKGFFFYKIHSTVHLCFNGRTSPLGKVLCESRRNERKVLIQFILFNYGRINETLT